MRSKSIELEDYVGLRSEGGLAPYVEAWARLRGAGFDVYEPHEHRVWEYAGALVALKRRPKAYVHNVGCGYTAFGAALAMQGYTVAESDVNAEVVKKAAEIGKWLKDRGLLYWETWLWDLASPKPIATYNAVVCISTIEHIPQDKQERAWENLVEMVGPGGLLYVTTDVSDKWADEPERAVGYTMDDVAKRIEWLHLRGFEVDADLEYHGPHVFNYSFYRIVATRR